MKLTALTGALAACLGLSAAQAATVIDNFDAGATLVNATSNGFGSTTAAGINADIGTGDPTRYYSFVTASSDAVVLDNVSVPGVMRLQHEGGNDYSYVNLSYQFSVPTDLGAFDTVSVLGSGVGGKGSLTVALADADGDFLWASSALTGSAFGDLVTPFASMSCTLVGGSSCDLDRIVGLEFLASGFDGQAYEHAVQEINLSFVGGGVPPVAPIPEPGTYALMLAGLGLVAVAARRRRAG